MERSGVGHLRCAVPLKVAERGGLENSYHEGSVCTWEVPGVRQPYATFQVTPHPFPFCSSR